MRSAHTSGAREAQKGRLAQTLLAERSRKDVRSARNDYTSRRDNVRHHHEELIRQIGEPYLHPYLSCLDQAEGDCNEWCSYRAPAGEHNASDGEEASPSDHSFNERVATGPPQLCVWRCPVAAVMIVCSSRALMLQLTPPAERCVDGAGRLWPRDPRSCSSDRSRHRSPGVLLRWTRSHRAHRAAPSADRA